jgi:hypothetical protein
MGNGSRVLPVESTGYADQCFRGGKHIQKFIPLIGDRGPIYFYKAHVICSGLKAKRH